MFPIHSEKYPSCSQKRVYRSDCSQYIMKFKHRFIHHQGNTEVQLQQQNMKKGNNDRATRVPQLRILSHEPHVSKSYQIARNDNKRGQKPHTSKSQATATFLLGSNTYFMSDSLIDNSSGNSFFSFEASSSLLLLGATITFACSSRLKFFQVNFGSI